MLVAQNFYASTMLRHEPRKKGVALLNQPSTALPDRPLTRARDSHNAGDATSTDKQLLFSNINSQVLTVIFNQKVII